MGNIGGSELLVILVIALLLLGPKRLPEVGEALGRTIRRFKQASRDLQDELDAERHLGLDSDAKTPAAPDKTQARDEKTEAP